MSAPFDYRLADLLPFSPETYVALVAWHNGLWFPAPILGTAVGVGIALVLLRPTRARLRGACLAGALACAWCAATFLAGSYGDLVWAGPHLAVLFCLQTPILLWGAVRVPHAPRSSRPGAALALFGTVVHPAVLAAAGRPVDALPAFGVLPDPTAIALLGLACACPRPWCFAAAAIPLLWCAVAAATAVAAGSPAILSAAVAAACAAVLLLVKIRQP